MPIPNRHRGPKTNSTTISALARVSCTEPEAQDAIGLAVNQSRVSNALVAVQNMRNLMMPSSVNVQSAESDIELYYRAQLAQWFSLMPNIQYVVRPNEVTTIPNAFVLGLQAIVTF